MVLRTPVLGIPYVEPTDTLTTYPTVSQELAQDTDAVGLTGVRRFTSAADRTAKWSSPPAGALSYLADTRNFWFYDGGWYLGWHTTRSRVANAALANGTAYPIVWDTLGNVSTGYKALGTGTNGIIATVAGVAHVTIYVEIADPGATGLFVELVLTTDGTVRGVTKEKRAIASGATQCMTLPCVLPVTAGQLISGTVTASGRTGTLTAAYLSVIITPGV